MALGRNFGKTNDALQRFMSFFMQNKLGELSNQRYMDVISEQDRLMRERSAEEDVSAHRRISEQHGMSMKEIFTRGLVSAANEIGLDGDLKMARQYEVAGDTASAEKIYQTMYKKAMPYIQAQYKLSTGKELVPEDVAANLIGGGVSGVEKGTSEAATSMRAARTAGIQEQELGIRKGELGVRQAELGLKAGGGPSGGTPLKTSDYYKAMHNKIEGVKKYLVAMKEAFDETGTIDSSIDLKQLQKLWGGTSIPEILGKALTNLNTLDTKAYRSPLSAQDESWIDRSQDITGLKQEFEGEEMGGLVAEKPDAETVKRMEGVESTAVNPPVVAVAPPPVKSPYEGTRKHVRETATGQEYWIVLRNGQWIRE